jgi:hypothetical protein
MWVTGGKVWDRLCQVTAATPETDLAVSEE